MMTSQELLQWGPNPMGRTLSCLERGEAGTKRKEGSLLVCMWAQGENPHQGRGTKPIPT